MDKVTLQYGFSYVLQGYLLQDLLLHYTEYMNKVSLPCGFSYVWSENYSDWTSYNTGYMDKVSLLCGFLYVMFDFLL